MPILSTAAMILAMPRTLTASISLGAMRHNLDQARRHAPNTHLWAVLKADAYGHGLLHAMQGFAKADGLALIEFEGAARLRSAGWQKPILMLEGPFDAQDVAQAAQQQLSITLHRPEHLDWLAAHSGPAVDVFLKINTGLNRLGFRPETLPDIVRRLRTIPAARLAGCMSHFANADLAGGTAEASRRFDESLTSIRSLLPAAEAERLMQCLANSAAVFGQPDTHRHGVRPGIALYGASPFADRRAAELGLRPAMRLHGSLIAVQTLQAGESTGYGGLFTADVPTRIGIVDCGYADGYPRVAPTGTPVAVDGVPTRTLGRVSMDMMAVDLNPVPAAKPGSVVELWGDLIHIDEVAAHVGTIGYELMCAVAPRVPRRVD